MAVFLCPLDCEDKICINCIHLIIKYVSIIATKARFGPSSCPASTYITDSFYIKIIILSALQTRDRRLNSASIYNLSFNSDVVTCVDMKTELSLVLLTHTPDFIPNEKIQFCKSTV